jgi:hypothetical protein
MKYKIIFNEYSNEYGKVTNSHYIIKIEKTFLWFKYWSTVKHTECDMTGSYKVPTEFKTIEEVHNYVMMMNDETKKKPGWNETVVEEARIIR